MEGPKDWKLYEEKVAKALTRKGFKVLVRNYRGRFGEIDLLAEKGNKLLVVEVKGGKRAEFLLQRVDCRKVKRMLLTLQEWLGENPSYESFEIFFVAALVGPDGLAFVPFSPDDCVEP
ncbi:MAG: hypothetical protein GXO08_04805 [Aquificae bacterium]|nr:hypothetical protein [Aquificota bacterium]